MLKDVSVSRNLGVSSESDKVGVIGQAETAALKKVSDNRSGPFVRKLSELCTSAT
jgi:DNA mismatch repair protein MSH3